MSIQNSSSLKEFSEKRGSFTRPLSVRSKDRNSVLTMRKTYTNLNSNRPLTGKVTLDLNGNFKLPQKQLISHKDLLNEENFALKTQSNQLESENLRLKTRINQLEKELNKREDPENFLYRTMNKPSLVPNLKSSIRAIKSKIKTKKEEIESLKKSMKSTKMMETDVELQIYSDERTRLKHHLEGIMKENNITFQMLDFEEKVFEISQQIEFVRNQNLEYGKVLANARGDLFQLKDKIKQLESPVKKKKGKKLSQKVELQNLMNLKEETIAKISVEREEFENRAKRYNVEIDGFVRMNREVLENIRMTETKLKEQNILADQLKSQMTNHEKEIRRAQTGIFHSGPSKVKKLKDPPKLFQKIYMIIHKRKMFLDIFFTLMDKNSNGIIDIDEIYNSLNTYGNKIKRKYIIEAFKLMEISGNSIPLSIIQEYYEKYEYHVIEEGSSSEEIVEPKKKPIERLNYHESRGSLPEGVIIPDLKAAPVKKIVIEEKKFQPVTLLEVKNILNEIQKKMQKLRMGKNKLLSIVFGSDIDPYELLTVNRLDQIFKASTLAISNDSEIHLLSRFLLENDTKSELTETQINELKSELLQVCKKLNGLFEDWPIYSANKLRKAFEVIQESICLSKNEILDKCNVQDQENTGSISLVAFREICAPFNIDSKHWDVWLADIYPLVSIDYIRFLSSIKTPKSGKESLKIVSENLSSKSIAPETLFSIDNEGVITAENFLEGIQNLNIDISEEEQLNLLDFVSTRYSGKFAKVVHINDLNKKLNEFGFLIQTISSDEETSPRISQFS